MSVKLPKDVRRLAPRTYALGFTRAIIVHQRDGRFLWFVGDSEGGFAESLDLAAKSVTKYLKKRARSRA